MNAEFQRIAQRGKKDFLRDQCKEIEENNRKAKTRDLFKKIRDTKGTFHAKMDSMKDRNGMDLTEAEDIKKRWQQYTEELYTEEPEDKLPTSIGSSSSRKTSTSGLLTKPKPLTVWIRTNCGKFFKRWEYQTT